MRKRSGAYLVKVNSIEARLIGRIERQSLNPGLSRSQYLPGLDSITTAMLFLEGKTGIPAIEEKLRASLSQLTALKEQLGKHEIILAELEAKKVKMQQWISDKSKARLFARYQREIYYYSQEIRNYKSLLSNPNSLGRKVIDEAIKSDAFQKFFQRNSDMAKLFPLQTSDEDSTIARNVTVGLQTRKDVEYMIDRNLGKGSYTRLFKSTSSKDAGVSPMSLAQQQLNRLKSLTKTSTSGGNEGMMPDFKVNTEKTKTFLSRIELGGNIQRTRSATFLPQTLDIGLSVGYKLSPNAVAGVGTSYIMGLGKDITHLSISHQGVGLRTFVDARLVGSVWLTGGGEMNYRAAFSKIEQLKNYSAWQKSMLLGVSKVLELKSSFARKTKIQILYDFLANRQTPQAQSFTLRFYYGM